MSIFLPTTSIFLTCLVSTGSQALSKVLEGYIPNFRMLWDIKGNEMCSLYVIIISTESGQYLVIKRNNNVSENMHTNTNSLMSV